MKTDQLFRVGQKNKTKSPEDFWSLGIKRNTKVIKEFQVNEQGALAPVHLPQRVLRFIKVNKEKTR